jgi:hypothetical protein
MNTGRGIINPSPGFVNIPVARSGCSGCDRVGDICLEAGRFG